jgi:hypothetical protein
MKTKPKASIIRLLRKWGAILAAATALTANLEKLLDALDPIVGRLIGLITGFHA